MMLGEAASPFCNQWVDNVNIDLSMQFEPNIPCGPRVMSIFTKRAQPAKMMIGEGLSPFCIPVAAQFKIHKY